MRASNSNLSSGTLGVLLVALRQIKKTYHFGGFSFYYINMIFIVSKKNNHCLLLKKNYQYVIII